MTHSETKRAIYFLSEQARRFIQAQVKESYDFKRCEKAVRLLTGDDPMLIQIFKQRISNIKCSPGDARKAANDLMDLADRFINTPPKIKALLHWGANVITEADIQNQAK